MYFSSGVLKLVCKIRDFLALLAYSGHTRKFSFTRHKEKTFSLSIAPAHTPLSNSVVVVGSCDFVKKESGETQQSRADNNTRNIYIIYTHSS